MATEITCIVPDSASPWDRVERVGAPGWVKDSETVVAEIEEGHEYFVEIASARVSVLVEEVGGRKCLRTDPDATPDNNLLRLPPCLFRKASRPSKRLEPR